jgi:hypothetical protein
MSISEVLRRVIPRVARKFRAFSLLLPALALFHSEMAGWVYPEHREISLRGIQGLDTHRRAILDSLWAIARSGHESRLNVAPADLTRDYPPTTIDYASWPAIAGDHSCSPSDLLHTVLSTQWIMDVAAVAARLHTALSSAGLGSPDRTNALRDSDLNLLRADPAYATHAGANNVHFLLPRPSTETTLQAYLETCMSSESELNALGAYAWYHVSALRKAHRLSQGVLSDSARRQLVLAAFADEAFALHFLEDAFAAGHVAGTRGDASLRKGTHDYYNEHGLEVRTWGGRSLILKGDAWMRGEDADRTAQAVEFSLEQFLDAADGKGVSFLRPNGDEVPLTADTLDACAGRTMPAFGSGYEAGSLVAGVVNLTPVPGLAMGDGELPRFRSELGPFLGIVPAVRGGLLFGGFGDGQTTTGGTGGLEVAARLGLGLDGVMNESGDGLVFLDLGLRLDGASSASIVEDEATKAFGSIFAAIPSRAAFTSRLRLPFWLLPLDLLISAPFLATTSPATFTQMATVAGNGGLIPWQAGIATSIGRFQFILGREIGIGFFGYIKKEDRVIVPYMADGVLEAALVNLRSVQLDFPVIEYMPFREFSSTQGSSIVIQLYAGVDIPTSVSVVAPAGDPPVDPHSVWQFGLRAAFRWRHYL